MTGKNEPGFAKSENLVAEKRLLQWVRSFPIALERIRKGCAGNTFVDLQKCFIISRIKGIRGRDHLATKEPRQPPGIKVAPLKRFSAEIRP